MPLKVFVGIYDPGRIALVKARYKTEAWRAIGIGRQGFYANYREVKIEDRMFFESLRVNVLYTKPIATESNTDFFEGLCDLSNI